MSADDVRQLLAGLSQDQKQRAFDLLRSEIDLHPLERELNTPAEVFLEAFHRADELTQRMMRGVLAEGAFAEFVLPALVEGGWQDLGAPGSSPDFTLDDGRGRIGLEIKLQRSEKGEPKLAHRMTRTFRGASESAYVVETQRTRTGEKGGEKTRPYGFGDFDVIGVSLWPSTGDWSRFRYAVASHLLPSDWQKGGAAQTMYHYQPVSMDAGQGWTDDFEEAADWFHSGDPGRIAYLPPDAPDLFGA